MAQAGAPSRGYRERRERREKERVGEKVKVGESEV